MRDESPSDSTAVESALEERSLEDVRVSRSGGAGVPVEDLLILEREIKAESVRSFAQILGRGD